MYLTALWITKNEEKNIGKSIDSVKDAVDEMIVVDTGSTDKTIEIAKQKGAKILNYNWDGDFAKARNYALDNAKYGIVIFLDADEYFEDPLTQNDKKILITGFKVNNNIDVLSIKREDIETNDGTIITEGESLRIFRHNGHLRYVGKIHEEIMNEGNIPIGTEFERKIIHTGYNSNIIKQKFKRDAQLLDAALENETDSFNKFNLQVYSIRENEASHPEKSFEYWKITAPQTQNWEYGISLYSEYRAHLFRSIIIAANNQKEVSRKFVKQELMDLYIKHYKDYYMSPFIKLIYKNYFDKRESLFLEDFDKTVEESNNKNIKKRDAREKIIIQQLYSTAAQASSKRGEMKRAAEYAKQAIDKKNFDLENNALLSIIVDYAIKQDFTELIEIMDEMSDYKMNKKTGFLSRQLIRENSKDIYVAYINYLINSDSASGEEILMHTLLTNGVKSVLNKLSYMLNSSNEDDVAAASSFVFIIMIAFNIELQYKNKIQGSETFLKILDSYFTEKNLVKVTQEDLNALYTYYPYIAFLGGKEAAEKFLNVFNNAPVERFAAYEDYSRRSENYEDILNYDTSKFDNRVWDISSAKIFAAIKLNKFDYALEKLKSILKGFVSFDVLNMLELLAELSEGDIQKEAQSLYDNYIDRFENMVDWNDIIVTDIIMDKKDVRFGKNAAKMTGKQLKQKIKDVPPKTDLSGYYEVLGNVLDKYKEQNYLGQYFDGLTELIAADVNKEENKEKLKELLKEAGNEKAEEMVALI